MGDTILWHSFAFFWYYSKNPTIPNLFWNPCRLDRRETPTFLYVMKFMLKPYAWINVTVMIEGQGSASCFKLGKSRFSTLTVQKRSLPHALRNNCSYINSCYHHNVTSPRFVWFYSQDHMIFPASWTSLCLLFPYYRFSENPCLVVRFMLKHIPGDHAWVTSLGLINEDHASCVPPLTHPFVCFMHGSSDRSARTSSLS